MVAQAMATYQVLAKNNANQVMDTPESKKAEAESDSMAEYYSDEDEKPRR